MASASALLAAAAFIPHSDSDSVSDSNPLMLRMNQKTVIDPFVSNSTATAFGVQNDNEADNDKDTGSSEGNYAFVDV